MTSRVQVAVRIRPPNESPKPNQYTSTRPQSSISDRLIVAENKYTVHVIGKNNCILTKTKVSTDTIPSSKEAQANSSTSNRYQFDHVFDHTSEQVQVYNSAVQPLVHSFLDGYNCTVFAYGQTNSGKTWTMGTEASIASQESQGLVSRALNDILNNLIDKSWEATLSVIEIYNEEIYDLLRPAYSPSPNLVLRENELGEVKAVSATEYRIRSCQDCFTMLRQALTMRSTGSTAMNARSSRSHVIITFNLIQWNTDPGVSINSKIVSSFNFVDLAGSERINRSATSGDRRREGIAINQGLLVLGQVINALTDATEPVLHVPYRDSKLTRVLQNSLGGNARTLMLVCISPDYEDYNESIGSLRYAIRAQSIRQKAVVNIQTNRLNENDEVSLRLENEQLRSLIVQLKSKTSSAIANHDHPMVPAVQSDMLSLNDYLAELHVLNTRVSKFKSHLSSIPIKKLAWD